MVCGVSFFVNAVPVSARSTVARVADRFATPAVPTASVVTANTPRPARSRRGTVERRRAGRDMGVYTARSG